MFEKDNELVVVEMNTSNLSSNLYKNYSYLFRIAGSRYGKNEKTYLKRVTKLIIIYSYRSIEALGIPVLFFYLQDRNNLVKRDMIESFEIYLLNVNKRGYNKIEKRLLLFEAKSYEEMRKITDEPEDLKVIEELERLSMDDYFRYMYNGKEVDERIANSRYEEGMEAGVEKGEKNKQIEIAKTMLQKNIELSLISELTGLSIDEVNILK